MLIDATHAEETRVVVVDGNKVEEFDFESAAKRQLAGNIYLAKVTRVEPSLQAAFVDYGGNRHGFLAFAEIHPDYYQIPVADREALLEEERAYAESLHEEDEEKDAKPRRRSRAAKTADDAIARDEGEEPAGMETLGDDDDTEDDDIESVADEDESDEVRPAARKARPRRYKIQEVVKVRQIMLVQVVKEERGNKGAALTTYLSLAGRYCVLMPNTARGGGISRKITNAADRKKLKEIAGSLEVPKGAGLIVRTAGSQRTKSEIKRDYEFLQRQWEQIRATTLESIAPVLIYEEGDLIKRSIRDLYSREIDEVIVEGAQGYRTAKDFMKMIVPSHARNVKPYADPMPLFARHQVESTLTGMFNPVVQLPSGGYIVIGITEALVAVDVNSGRATKEGSIEQTALKTNLEAAEEVARQMRLRDLAGLVVIDFIDMDERKNNAAVEKRMKDKLKSDRARIQVGRISGFGLMELSRQRLRPGMLEATTQPCAHCHGTGLIRSDENVALGILRSLEEEGTRGRSKEVLLKVPYGVLNFLINYKREHIAAIEQRYDMAVRLEGDGALIAPDFSIEKFKTATRVLPELVPAMELAQAIPGEDDNLPYDEPEEEEEAPEPAQEAASEARSGGEDSSDDSDEDGKPKKKRRRRRRRRGGNGENGDNGESGDQSSDDDGDDAAAQEASEPAAQTEAPATDEGEQPAKKPRRSRSRRRKADPAPEAAEAPAEQPGEAEAAPEAAVPNTPLPSTEQPEPAAAEAEMPGPLSGPEPVVTETAAAEEPAPEPAAAEPAPAAAEEAAPAEEKKPARPKRRGWWALGR
nr:ribonuclease E/G [Pseudoroseicyclus aestuarii]